MNELLQPLPPSGTNQGFKSPNNTADWFDHLPEEPQSPKKSHKKILPIIGLGLIVIITATLAVLFGQQKQCLTTDDLIALTGIAHIDTVTAPSEDFFTYSVSFQSNSASYDTNAEKTGGDVIQNIANFYKAHPKASMLFTIDSTYFETEDKALAAERIATVKSGLIASGIDENHITASEPAQVDREDASQQITTAIISITSATSCQ